MSMRRLAKYTIACQLISYVVCQFVQMLFDVQVIVFFLICEPEYFQHAHVSRQLNTRYLEFVCDCAQTKAH
jgi:hypothetical protein